MFYRKKSGSISPRSALENKDENCRAPANEVPGKVEPAKPTSFCGFICTFVYVVCLAFIGVFVKKLSYINPGPLSAVRHAGIFVGCLPIVIYSGREVLGPKEYRKLLISRSLLSASLNYLFLTAFRYLPLAEAVIIVAILPTATTIAAKFSLKEKCGRVLIVCIVMSLCGVLLSVRLPELLSKNRDNTRFDYTYLGGLAAALATVVIGTFTFVALRKMKDLHFSVPMLYLGFLGTVFSSVISFFASDVVYPTCGLDMISAMLIGILSFIAQIGITLALQKDAAGIVAVVLSSLNIVVGMIFQVIFSDDDIDVYNISGACLVIVSLSMIGFNKWLHMLPEDSNKRTRFKYLM